MLFDDAALVVYRGMSQGEAVALFNAECERAGLSRRDLARRVAALDLDPEREGHALDYAHLKRKLNPGDVFSISMQDVMPLTLASGVDVLVLWMLARLLEPAATVREAVDWSPGVAAALMAEIQIAAAELAGAMARSIGRMDGPGALDCDQAAKGMLLAVGRALSMVRAHVHGVYRHTPRSAERVLFQSIRPRPWWARLLGR